MGVREVPTQYETSDGKKWETKQEAERQERLMVTRRNFADARQSFMKALAETQKTADGRLFELGMWHDYWYVMPTWHANFPGLAKVAFSYLSLVAVDEYLPNEYTVVTDNPDPNGRPIRYRISDLYWSKDAAEHALLEAQEAWLAERSAEVEALRNRIIPQAPPEDE